MFYNIFGDELLKGNIDFISDDIEVLLIDTSEYTFNINHQYESQIPESAIISSAILTGCSILHRRFFADDVSFSDKKIKEGKVCDALILVKNTGYLETSVLIKYIDKNLIDDEEFPTEVDSDFSISWPVEGIFELFEAFDETEEVIEG
jgi:hypothetical protein